MALCVYMDQWEPPSELEVKEGDLSSLEINVPCDIHDLEVQKSDYTSQTYERLARKARKNLTKELSRDSNGNYDTVIDYLNIWKNPNDYDEEIAQSYERLMKEALDIPTEVRNGGEQANFPSQFEIHTIRQLYLATQCFLAVHFGTKDEHAKKRVYRGIREPSIAKLVAQVIDNPNSDRYYFHTSTISNHSGIEGVGFYHSNGIVIDFLAPREVVAFCPDRLMNTPSHEDEFQLVGGTIRVGANRIIHEGTQSERTRRLQTLIRSMDEPESLDEFDHKDIADLVEMMFEADEPVTTQEGAKRLEEWFHEVDSQEIFSVRKNKTLRAQIQCLTEAGKGNHRINVESDGEAND